MVMMMAMAAIGTVHMPVIVVMVVVAIGTMHVWRGCLGRIGHGCPVVRIAEGGFAPYLMPRGATA